MELEFDKPNIETSNNFESEYFGVSDLTIIFDILRNKMYSSPIKAICREITCNARDAHREVGTPEKPIEISLPTFLDPFLKIKDYGPGISPDRMTNVFIKYAASTKRSDNSQTGGFGLGAKTPFSYTDTFNIITIHNGIKYNYSCFIDESKLGKLVQLQKTKTNLPNGTEIVIPVKKHDENTFQYEIVDATIFWDVKPIITNKSFKIPNIPTALKGSCWKLYSGKKINKELNHNYNDNNYYDYRPHLHSGGTIAIVDGIKYPIHLSKAKNSPFADMLKRRYGSDTIALHFDVGELMLSANRESIYLDDKQNKSITAINNKIDLLEAELLKSLEEKIKSCKTWWEACIKFNSILLNNDSLFGSFDPKWNGKTLLTETSKNKLANGLNFYCFKNTVKDNKEPTIDDIKSTNRWNSRIINFDKDNNLFVYCDLDISINRRHALKIFKLNPGLKTLQIFTPQACIKDNSFLNEEGIKELISNSNAEPYDKYFKSYKKSRNDNKDNYSPPLYIYKYNLLKDKFQKISKQDFKDCKNKKVLATLATSDLLQYYQNKKDFIQVNNKPIETSVIKTIIDYFSTKNTKIKVFAVLGDAPEDKVKKVFKKITTIESMIKLYLKKSNINFALAKSIDVNKDFDDNSYTIELEKQLKLIKNPNSYFIKYVKSKEKANNLKHNKKLCLLYENIYGEINKKEIDKALKEFGNEGFISSKDLYTKYPLLQELIYGYPNTESVYYTADYINLIDKEQKLCQKKKK